MQFRRFLSLTRPRGRLEVLMSITSQP